jgi:vanillate O-demethylase ferredoxin subunit
MSDDSVSTQTGTPMLPSSRETGRLFVRVSERRVEAEEVVGIELRAAGSGDLPPFSAGSHIELQFTPNLTRAYSLCNSPAERDRYVIAVLREPHGRGGSAHVHENVKVGDLLSISHPKNLFELDERASKSLFFAGGIGITPIVSMAERLQALRRDFSLHYFSRSAARTAFLPRLSLAAYAPRVHLHHGLSVAATVDAVKGALDSADPETDVYVCGPRAFIDTVLDSARARGWMPERLHAESFGGDVRPLASDAAFVVQLASSGLQVTVSPDESVVDALRKEGVHIDTSCEQGVCGTCLTRVLHGVPDHRDMFLLPDEKDANDQFLPCCSRSKSALLVLDL